MPAPQRTYAAFSTVDTGLVTTAETVVATLAGINTQDAAAPINIAGWAAFSTGTGVTAVTARLRRNSGAGAVVGEGATVQVGASLAGVIVINEQDAPGEVASFAYVLTLQQVGATGNGAANTVNLLAIVGN